MRAILENKQAEVDKQRRVNRGLAKLKENKSEKQHPTSNASDEQQPVKKEHPKTNNGAKRKNHCNLEVQEIIVEPDDALFNPELTRLFKIQETVRYELIPMRFIKKIYRLKTYKQGDRFFAAKAPFAPLLNSNYDGSFIAGIAQLRYIYSMPVERIVKLFCENGFELNKSTAHGLLTKTERLFENLYKALAQAIKEDNYIAGDETYHRVLTNIKNKDGKGIKTGYIWVVASMNTKLTYYFYDEGSRRQDIIFNYLGNYNKTFQSDGFAPYRNIAKQLLRLGCFQHVKRKFLDVNDDPDCQQIVQLINQLYHCEHQHKIGQNGWTEHDNYQWRQQYAPPILAQIKQKLDSLAADPHLLPKSEKYNAVHYMLTEWTALTNIFTRGNYNLDNNFIERNNRYISLSRRNSLFFGSHAGAQRAAIYYSLATSCRALGINFFEYLTDIINRAAQIPPNAPPSRYRDLLPDRWQKQNAIAETLTRLR